MRIRIPAPVVIRGIVSIMQYTRYTSNVNCIVLFIYAYFTYVAVRYTAYPNMPLDLCTAYASWEPFQEDITHMCIHCNKIQTYYTHRTTVVYTQLRHHSYECLTNGIPYTIIALCNMFAHDSTRTRCYCIV